MTDKDSFFSILKKQYIKTLLYDVVPFWMTYAVGSKDGAINNCVDDSGRIISTNRYLWSQGRALWTFSALYNKVEKKQEWLDVADGIFNYLCNHGRDEEGYWMYLLDDKGNIIERDISIYVDGFILNGLGEYFIATKNEKAKKIAEKTFENVVKRLSVPGGYKTAPYDIPVGMKVHGTRMIFSYFLFHLGDLFENDIMRSKGHEYAIEILKDFYDPVKDAVLEFVTEDGSFSDTGQSRICIPGHVIESMWFLISIFEKTKEYTFIRMCSKLIKRHLELGWDSEYKGLLLAIDIDGKTPICWDKHDYKAWWVHVEALVATLYAYKHTHEDWCLIWHEKIRKYAYSQYPHSNGEWIQWLDRFGDKSQSAALPVKDPFHLPRALITMIDFLNKTYHNGV